MSTPLKFYCYFQGVVVVLLELYMHFPTLAISDIQLKA